MLKRITTWLLLFASGPAYTQEPAPAQSPSHGQAQKQAQKASDLLARARDVYSGQGARAALPEFEKALALFRQERDRRGEAITLGLIGNCYKRFGDFPKALEYLQRALPMKRELGDRAEEGKSLSHLGLLYWEMGQYALAIEYLTRAIGTGSELGDRVLEASSRNNLGLVYDELGNYRRSQNEYRRALELYQGTNFERGISDTIGNLGGVHLLLGEYSEALRYYQQSLAISERLSLKASASQDLGNIALCYLGLGRMQDALQHFDRALRLAREATLKKEEADWQKGKGSALVQLGNYAQALDQYREALQTYEQAGLKRELIEALGDLGTLEVRLGDAGSAEKDFRRALEFSRTIGHPHGVTLNLIALGNLEWRRKRFEEAATLYRDALARANEANDRASSVTARIQLALTYRDLARLQDAAQEARQALEIARSIQARPLEAEALYAQGEVARTLGRQEEALEHYASGEDTVRETADPELGWRLAFGRGQSLEVLERNEEALAAYQSAVKTIDLVRSQLREERFRAGYIEDKYQVYVALVQLLLKLKRTDEAFMFAERLRARSYLDLLSRGQPPIRNDAQRQAGMALQSRIRQLQRKIQEEASKPSPDQRRQALDLFSKELADAERDYQNVLDDLFRAEPGYTSVRALKAPSGGEVQHRLRAGTALVEYVLAEENLVIFVVTSHGLRAKTVPTRATDLQGKVELLRGLMLRNHTDEWKLPAASLYRTLIDPLKQAGWLDGIDRLYIVPHAILHYVPFAVLLRTAGNTSRFLIDEYVLAYLPSAATLVYGGDASRSSKSVLAMAPANTRLLYTQRESQSISEFFPNQHTLLLGSHATESSFKRLGDRYDVIHFATHGYFNKLNPLLSGLVLEPDGNEDGRLEVHEILRLRLNAQLVTLSACDTALGGGYFAEVPAGDDLVGLTQAFLFAGSPTVLASLWEVNDRSAVRLMQSFYRQLRQTDKAAALAKAQRDMRVRGGRYVHPYFWGAFVLVGQMN